MKSLARQLFHQVYGDYLKSLGFIKKKEVYYKIDWEKKMVAHVGLHIFLGGHSFDVFVGYDPFCAFPPETFPCESILRIGHFGCYTVEGSFISWNYDNPRDEAEVKAQMVRSFDLFQKVVQGITPYLSDLSGYYRTRMEIEKKFYRSVLYTMCLCALALKLHDYDVAEKCCIKKIKNSEEWLNTNEADFEDYVRKFGEEVRLNLEQRIADTREAQRKANQLLSAIRQRNIPILESYIKEQEEITKKEIVSYFGPKILPLSK